MFFYIFPVLNKDSSGANPDAPCSPTDGPPHVFFCWSGGNLRLRRGLQWRLMGFSVDGGLSWGLMVFKVGQWISIWPSEARRYLDVRFIMTGQSANPPWTHGSCHILNKCPLCCFSMGANKNRRDLFVEVVVLLYKFAFVLKCLSVFMCNDWN